MAMLTSNALTGIRNYIKRTVAYAKYKYNGSYVKTSLNDVTIGSDGVIRISFTIEPGSSSGSITEVQLYDSDSNLWLSKSVNLSMSNVTTGYFELVELELKEVDE